MIGIRQASRDSLLGRASRAELESAFRVLIACAVDSPRDESALQSMLGETLPPLLLELADFHRVTGLMYEVLRKDKHAPEVLVDGLGARYVAAVAGHMRAMDSLAIVRDAFDRVGCRWAVFKGPVAVETLYGGFPGRRAYLDLDVLVAPEAFGDVLSELDRVGGTLVDRNWIGMRRSMRGEVHVVLPGGMPVDLHWNLIDMYRRNMHLDTGEILDRARMVDLGGLLVPTLDAADGVLHLAFHAAYSGGDRLLWLKDVERAVALWQPEWETVVERALEARIGRSVGLIMDRSQSVLQAPIPEEVRDKLLGRKLLRAARVIDHISPWQFGFGRLAAPTRLFSRSVGHGLPGAAAWVVARAIRNLDPWQQRRTSTFTRSGGAREREAFINAVINTGNRNTSPPVR
jgi:hypothetical protein